MSRRAGRWIVRAALAGVATAGFAWSAPASANGRFPATNQLVVMPGKPSTLLVRSTFGLLLSKDTGKTWDWVCEEAAVGCSGAMNTENPGVALTASGAIVISSSQGLVLSPDTGCSWGPAKMGSTILAGQVWNGSPIEYFVDDAVRPNAPHSAVAAQSAYDSDSAAQTFLNQVYATTDDGAHWSKYGDTIDESFIVDTVEVTESDPHRIYVSAETTSPAPAAALFESTTDGTNWIKHPIPILAGEEGAFIAAVDPTNPDRVYLRTGDHFGLQPSRLLVTDDGGKTFAVKYVGNGTMGGFALSSDGATVYIGFGPSLVDGGTLDGLLSASTKDFVFTQRSPTQTQCLALSGSTLYACAPEVDGFILGASTDQGATFTTLLHLCSVRGPLDCPADTAAGMQCPAEWEGGTSCAPIGQGAQLGVPCLAPPEAGPPDAGAKEAGMPDAGTEIEKGLLKPSSPGCDFVPSRSGATAGWYGLGAMLAVWGMISWRRARRR